MPSRSDVYYFGAGPAPLPTAVLEEAAKNLLSYKDSGVGITEISHRSADATAILEHTKSCLRQLLVIPDDYEVLFLQGGGSGEFSAVVYNMVSHWAAKNEGELRLDYLVTGSWSLKASQEAARLVGKQHVNVVVDARKDGKFGTIPGGWTPSANPALTYYCDNETVDGVEFQETPDLPNLVADMSSNILSRKVDVRKHVAIFAGAQKNIGTTGVTIVIVRKDVLVGDPAKVQSLGLPLAPVVLDWPTIAKNNSLYNTLPIFDVWIAGAVMQRIIERGGMAVQQAESDKKAKMIYDVLDERGYAVVPDKSVRSRMNICFRIEGDEKEFVKKAEAQGLLGIKGHRSVGGMRISNYNAVPVEAVQKLVKFLREWRE